MNLKIIKDVAKRQNVKLLPFSKGLCSSDLYVSMSQPLNLKGSSLLQTMELFFSTLQGEITEFRDLITGHK